MSRYRAGWITVEASRWATRRPLPKIPKDGRIAILFGAGASYGYTDTLAENREKLSNGGHYTIVAIADTDDDADSFGELRVLDDELKPITNGKARVRFVNAVAGLDDEISVFPRGSENALVDGINFKMEAGWNEEDPWSGTLEVRTEDRKSPLATVPNVDLKAGGTYTFVIAGTPNKVEVIQVKDQVARDPDADDAMPDNRTEKSPNN
jgi:hypothetical protein